MTRKQRLANPLALAVLVLLFERPMHPYEMAATLKERHNGESIKLRYGSLYTVIELLVREGFIVPKETSREGRRPERTVYMLTPVGEVEMRDWLADLIGNPAKEYPRFEAALSLMPALRLAPSGRGRSPAGRDRRGAPRSPDPAAPRATCGRSPR